MSDTGIKRLQCEYLSLLFQAALGEIIAAIFSVACNSCFLNFHIKCHSFFTSVYLQAALKISNTFITKHPLILKNVVRKYVQFHLLSTSVTINN